ncbi:uncharacterized protein LOC134682050 [Mytilus trossulus]|uniref:uncharacterized protein LOC134682050 n=1 Tax=Mytilus trossulus TaxID=6551 RepID=UPI00300667B0
MELNMPSLNSGTRNEDYYCGLIYSELIEGPLRETDLLHRLVKLDVLAVEVRQCLVLMEKNGSICKTGAQETVWQLDSEIHSGDFSEDTILSDSSLNDLCAGIENTSLESSTSENTVPKSSLGIESLPPPAKRTISKRPAKDTNIKAASSTNGQNSFEPRRSNSEQTSPKTTPPASGEHSLESSLVPSLTSSTPNRSINNSESMAPSLTSSTPNRSINNSESMAPSLTSFTPNKQDRSLNNSESMSSPDSSLDSIPSTVSGAAGGSSRGCMLTQTVMQGDDQSSRVQQRYLSQVQTGPNTQTISAGNINLETTAPVNCHQHTEIDQRLKPTLENLKKIISVFVKPNMNLKPKDVAQKCGLGKSRKAANKLLYHLAKKNVLTVTTSDGKDPKWNKGPSAQYSERDLQEWAAEIEYGSTSSPAPTPVVNHHHHNHQHEHNTYLQVGDQNVMALDPNNQEEKREREVVPASEDMVSNLQHNSQ